jgi:hypothetical protein
MCPLFLRPDIDMTLISQPDPFNEPNFVFEIKHDGGSLTLVTCVKGGADRNWCD